MGPGSCRKGLKILGQTIQYHIPSANNSTAVENVANAMQETKGKYKGLGDEVINSEEGTSGARPEEAIVIA